MKRKNNYSLPDVEWRTIALLLANNMFWIICVLSFHSAPIIFGILMCLVLTLQSSLTHELIHGHPTSSNAINMSLGIVPLTLFYPIHLFKQTHLKHHQDVDLTSPDSDPESFFHCPTKWKTRNNIFRLYAWINMTLTGRLVFATPRAIVQVTVHAIQDILNGSWPQRIQWALHFSLLILLVLSIIELEAMPLEIYFLCACIAHSTIALRAFFEHRPALQAEHRIVIVNSNLFFRFLFLFNNLHAVHHRYPRLPWYQIAEVYEETRTEVLDRNDRFFFSGYLQWLGYLFRPIHSPVHPGMGSRDS